MRRQSRRVTGAALILGVAILSGCTSGTDYETGSDQACGILDSNLLKEARGTAKFSNSFDQDKSDSELDSGLLAVGDDDDSSPRKKFDCTITDSTSHVFLQISGRNKVDDADREQTLADFTDEATEPGCEEHRESPAGSICTDGAKTAARLMFTDRWVRVTAEAKRVSADEADATISPELVLKIAENVNSNLG